MGQKFAVFDASGALASFYDSEDSPLPEELDGVALTDDAWQSLLAAQGAGKLLRRGGDGQPEAVDAPPPPPPDATEVLARRDVLLAQAALRVAPLEDAIDLDIETPEDIEALTAWKQYRVALNRLAQQAGFPADVEWPVAPQ